MFPRNGLLAARICTLAGEATWLPAFIRAVYQANFERDQDIADPGVIADCLRLAGQAPEALLQHASTAEAKNALKARNEEVLRLGIFGAPMFVHRGELFWGNDRLHTALAAARRA